MRWSISGSACRWRWLVSPGSTRGCGPALARAPVGARCGGVMPDIPCQLYAWPQRYDYLLRFAADADAAAPPGAGYLRQVARAGWVTLYLVLPSAPAGR